MQAVIADDSVLVREGITRILAEGGIDDVVGMGDASSLIDAVETLSPDLAIVDVRMPPTYIDEGLRSEQRSSSAGTGPTSPCSCSHSSSRSATRASCGARTEKVGYLLKDRISDVVENLEALQRDAAGGTALDPQVVRQRVARSQKVDTLSRLTPRERDLLSLMAEGRSNTAIAQALVVSTRAVGKHIASIFMKLVHTSRGRRAPPARDGGRAVSEQLTGAA